MEAEIDLRRYIYIALKYKFWLIGVPVLIGLITYLIFLTRPAVYESQASLAMLRQRSEVAFEPKFKTVELGDTDTTVHRATLLALTLSPNIATTVLQQMSGRLGEVNSAEKLLNLISAEQTGNLLVITAKANQPDLAAELANTWAQQTELYINKIYGQSIEQLADIQAKQTDAYKDYALKQKSVEEFISISQIRALNRQISDLTQYREDLYKRNLSIIDLGLDTQLLLAKGDSEEYYQTLTEQRGQVGNQQKNQARDLFDYYDGRAKLLNQYLVSMQALQQQITQQATNTVSLGDVLAIVETKIKLFSQIQPPKDSPQSTDATNLQLGDVTALANNPAQVANELQALIAQIEAEQQKTAAQLETISKDLSKGSNYQYTGITLADTDPLLGAATRRLQAMTDLKGLDKVFPDYEKSPLYQKIKELDTKLNQLSSQLEAEQAKQKELVGERDLAWEAYQTIQRKAVEIQVSEQAPSSEVRFVTQALPSANANSTRTTLNALIAMIGSFIITLLAVMALDWWRNVTPQTT